MTDTPNTSRPSEAAMELACGILGDWDVSYAAQVMTASMIDAALARARVAVDYKGQSGAEVWCRCHESIRALLTPTPQGETKEQKP